MTHSTIKPILKYPGAKWRLAPWIVAFFPAHLHYVEPYAGSAACFFAKAPAPHEVLNDSNGHLVNFFRVLRTQGEALARLIEMTPWAEAEYTHIVRVGIQGDELERARQFLVRCWQAHGGTLSCSSGWKHNGVEGRVYPVRLWQQLPTRLLAVVERLRDAEIRDRPALDIIDAYNTPDCLLYCDPPYVLATRDRKYYADEMTDADHRALLDALNRHTGAVVLSGYSHPLYDAHLAHWYRVATPAIAEHGKHRTEVLWLNAKAAHHHQLPLFERQEDTMMIHDDGV